VKIKPDAAILLIMMKKKKNKGQKSYDKGDELSEKLLIDENGKPQSFHRDDEIIPDKSKGNRPGDPENK
jgi:hypothetical protein